MAVVVAGIAAAGTATTVVVAAVVSAPIDPSGSELTSSFLPNQFGSSHEGHISCPGTENNPTHCGPDGDGKHNTLFDPLPYSNLPSQEGV